MLPRLLLVVGLTIGVMLPLIWAAFAPVPGFREASEPVADPVHSRSAGADWRGTPTPEAAEPSNSTARSNEATIGTAPDGEGEASAGRSDGLPQAGVSEPTLIAPSLPSAYDKKAAPEPLLSEEAKPLPEGAKPSAEKAERLPEKATTPTISEGEASAARSDDLPRTGLSEPTLIKPNLPPANDKEAAPQTLRSEQEKPLLEEAKPAPQETTTPTFSEGEASAARSDDPPRLGVSEPTLTKPSLPPANDKEAAPAPLVSEKAKSPPEEATTPTVNSEKRPAVKKRPPVPGASHNSRSRARADGTGSRPKMHRKKQRDRSGWVEIMREAGWLAPGRRR